MVSTAEVIIFAEPHDDSCAPEILDLIPLVDVAGVRPLIGHGDEEAAQSRRPVSFPQHQRSPDRRATRRKADSDLEATDEPNGKNLFARFQDAGGGDGGGGGGWVATLPRMGGGTQFANTVEIRRRAAPPPPPAPHSLRRSR